MKNELKTLNYGKQYIDEDDIDAVVEVLRSDFITCGPKISKLEQDLCDLTTAKYAVAVSNGTSALHLACLAIGIKEGDEVITTPMTFAASANCVLYCGGTPVFADINPMTWNIDPQSVREKISTKTKAVIAVDFTGQVAELDEIKKICEENNLKLIEDGAHSLGSKYDGKPVGSIADMTTFSFHPVKTVTGGEGGAVLMNDETLYKKVSMLRNHGMTDVAESDYERQMQDNHPVNLQVQVDLGFNDRMTDFQAALISSQLKKLGLFGKRRKEIVARYNQAFENTEGLIVQQEISKSDSLKHLYVLRFELEKLKVSRKAICSALADLGVLCKVHYVPVYYHPYYQGLGYQKGLCPKAEALYDEILTLPLYYSMTNEDVEQVICAVKKVVGEYVR